MSDATQNELSPSGSIPNTNDTTSARKYFKPMYLAIYVLLAVLVYGFIHFLFLAEGSQFNLRKMVSEDSQFEEYSAETSFLGELNGTTDPSINGLIFLYTEGTGINVQLSLNLENVVTEGLLEAGIYKGSCDDVGSMLFGLSNVRDGISESIINEEITELSKSFPLIVIVGKTQGSQHVEVACGEIIAG